MAYEDKGHRPHAVHVGEAPFNPISHGPEGITVTLDTWGPQEELFTTIYDALQSNWGDAPSRSAEQRCRKYGERLHDESEIDCRTGWCRLTDGQREYVESCFQGKTLNQVLELLTFEFAIDGIARVCTHQLVRTRIGAAFMQHGGRDNDWRHRPWTMPETIRRACDVEETTTPLQLGQRTLTEDGMKHCVKDWQPIEDLLSGPVADRLGNPTLRLVISDYLEQGRSLYSALVDAGIPWQDARRLLWMGTQTYIHNIYNFVALQGVASKRLEFAMDWEINCVAQLMVREVRTKCHPIIGKYLQSISDKLGVAAFAGLESWTPSGKHDNPFEICAYCKHAKSKHEVVEMGSDSESNRLYHYHCEECEAAGKDVPGGRSYPMGPDHIATFVDGRPRTHVPEQSPFWILHPDSMAGGPVVWIPTNGVFPAEYK